MSHQETQIEAVFLKALEIQSPQARAAFLQEECAGREELRARVERMLAAQSHLGGFLDQGAAQMVPTIDQSPLEKPGTQIGPYKLLQQIGEGGMGVVYLAEQTEPVKRRVALKIIKPGMDTRQVIARFEAERQALSLMDHPNIAKVLDAGTTDSGRPYFVMELVKGQPITQYCDEKHLTPRQRLELLLPVCQAIQHAHQKGIIHRDIKPTNILVAEFDQQPVPKVIDFGVAKATGQALTEKTMFTDLGQIVGTLEYMSPEQAKVNQLDIDTRSDIYSLGVLLYELLTGSTPFDKQRLRSAAWDEMLRIIREEEPPKPSTRLSDLSSQPMSSAHFVSEHAGSGIEPTTLASIAALRQTEPAKLTRLVRGELDWIVMKALEKDRNRRYETANGFAMDLQRYLSDEPVQACPPSAVYRLGKFARRNRLKLIAAAVLSTALLVAIGGIGWAVRDRAAQQADAARAKAERISRSSSNVQPILAETNRLMADQKWPEALAAVRRAGAAVAGSETDAATVQEVQTLLKDLEFIDRLEQARMAETTTVGGSFNYAGAGQEFMRAFRDYGLEVDTLPVETTATRLKARPALAIPLGAALDTWVTSRRVISPGDAADWKRLVDVARDVDPDPMRNQIRSTWGQPLSKVADKLEQLAKSIDVRKQHLATVVSLARTLRRSKHSDSALQLFRDAQYVHPADFWLNFELGNALFFRKDYAGALRYFTAAASIRPDSAGAHNNLGNVLVELRKLDEAFSCYSKAIELDPNFAAGHANLGNLLRRQKKLVEAIAACRQALEIDPKCSYGYMYLGGMLWDQKKHDEAVAAYQSAIKSDPSNVYAYTGLSNVLRDQGKLDEAISACRQALEIDPQSSYAYNGLGSALFAQKKLDEGREHFRKAIELDPGNAVALSNLGGTLRRQKPVEALALCRKAIELEPLSANGYLHLGIILHDQKQFDDAVAVYHKALELEPNSAAAHGNLASVLLSQKKTDEAITHCRQAIELDANLAIAHNNLGTAFFAQKKFTEAGAAFRRAIELEPELANAYYGEGNVLLNENKLDEAIAAYRKAIEIVPELADCHHNIAVVLRRQNKLDEAAAAYRKAAEVEPNNANRHLSLGNIFHSQSRYAEAAAAYRTATQVDPQYALAFGVLGDVLVRQNKLEEAFAAYHRALEIRPDFALVYCGLGEALSKDGKLDAAVAAFRKAIELNPKYAQAFSDLGRALQAQGKLDEAVQAHQEAIKLNPQDLDIRLGLGGALYLQKKFAEAVDVSRQALAMAPNNPQCHLVLGAALAGQGKLDESIAAHRKAIELAPNPATAQVSLARVLKARGKLAEAIAAHEDVIRLFPRGPIAMNELAWLLATCSDPKIRDGARAVELAKKAVELAPTNDSFRNTLGVAHYRTSNWKAALEALDESQELRKGGDSKDWFFRAMAHWQLGDKEAARTWYAQAVQWTDKHQPRTKNSAASRQKRQS